MVEMAIVLPVLLMLVFAVAEFSIAFLRWQAVGNAARSGAREASLFRTNCSSSVNAAVEQVVNDVLGSAGIGPSSPTIGGTQCGPGTSQVTVSVPYTFQILPNFASGLDSSINLTATSVMRNEFPTVGGGS